MAEREIATDGCTCNRRRCANIECRRAYARANYAKGKRERAVERKKRWRGKNPEKVAAQTQRARRRSPEKYHARVVLGNALRDGKVTKGSCEQGPKGCRGSVDGHHDDYAEPLKVRWLCRAHHAEEHRRPA